jgi:hypothetical protein
LSTLGGHKLGGLNTRAATQRNSFVVTNLKTHVIGFHYNKIGTPPKTRIDGGIQIASARTDRYLHNVFLLP